MAALLNRLIASGASYQAGAVIAAALAALMLPFYTRALTPEDYGVAETLLTYLILLSIPLRLGLGEAFVRFWFDDDDPEHRSRVSRQATGTVLATTTTAALIALVFAGDLSELLLDERDATLMAFGILGLWAFSNLEIAYAHLRVEERRRTYFIASLINVLLTVALTFTLVVILDTGARGYVAGNYVASTFVLFGLWWIERERFGIELRGLGDLLRFGAPTIPADMAVFALNVFDRAYLLQSQGKAAAGVYAVSVKLATAVIIAVRGFQLAWPPLAYSIADDDEARRFYAAVTTWYVAVTGIVVAGMALLGRWLVRLLAAPDVLRGARGAAVGRARLGVLRALPRLRRDRRPGEGHDPPAARRDRGPGAQRRAGDPARRPARHRRRGHRARRVLPGDAGGAGGAHPALVRGAVRDRAAGPRGRCSSPA